MVDVQKSSAPITVSTPMRPVVDTKDAEIQSDPVPKKDASEEILDELEGQVYQLQVDLANAQQLQQDSVAENDDLKIQMESLIKEKRTDIILRYENDIKQLKQNVSELSDAASTARSEKAKSDSKLKELQERAVKAEEELRERDAMELKKLNVNDEKVILTTKVQKQREEIVLKAKAATAGNLSEYG